MELFDAVKISGTRTTKDGYVQFDARAARTGVQEYSGVEVGKPEIPIVRVYRPAEEVFSSDAMSSFAFKPMTNDHPAQAVTRDNWKDLSVGIVGGEVARDGDWIKVPMALMDKAAIADVQDGKRELSAGYSCELDWTAGQTEDGQSYHAIQRNIRINHVAVVEAARAGPSARIGDAKPGKEPEMKTIIVDGISVEVSDAHAQIVERTIAKMDDEAAAKDKAIADAKADHEKAIEAKDEEIGKLKADLKTAEDAAVKPEDLGKMVADRAALVTQVKTIDAEIKVEGVSDTDLKKAAVSAKLGEDAVKDASDAEISGMFKAISKDAKPADPLARALGDAKPVHANDAWSEDTFASAGVKMKKGA